MKNKHHYIPNMPNSHAREFSYIIHNKKVNQNINITNNTLPQKHVTTYTNKKNIHNTTNHTYTTNIITHKIKAYILLYKGTPFPSGKLSARTLIQSTRYQMPNPPPVISLMIPAKM